MEAEEANKTVDKGEGDQKWIKAWRYLMKLLWNQNQLAWVTFIQFKPKSKKQLKRVIITSPVRTVLHISPHQYKYLHLAQLSMAWYFGTVWAGVGLGEVGLVWLCQKAWDMFLIVAEIDQILRSWIVTRVFYSGTLQLVWSTCQAPWSSPNIWYQHATSTHPCFWVI